MEVNETGRAITRLEREPQSLHRKIQNLLATMERMGLSLKRAPSREELEGLKAMSEMKENQNPESVT